MFKRGLTKVKSCTFILGHLIAPLSVQNLHYRSDSERLDRTMSAKLPKGVGPATKYRVVPEAGGVGVFSDKQGAPRGAE